MTSLCLVSTAVEMKQFPQGAAMGGTLVRAALGMSESRSGWVKFAPGKLYSEVHLWDTAMGITICSRFCWVKVAPGCFLYVQQLKVPDSGFKKIFLF